MNSQYVNLSTKTSFCYANSISVPQITTMANGQKLFSGASYFAYFEFSTARCALPSFHPHNFQHYAQI
jgi:hypothetical protein